VDLGGGAVFGRAEGADVGKDVEPECMLRQRGVAFDLRPIGSKLAGARALVAATDLQDQAGRAPSEAMVRQLE
jgi:hypothetical protein